MFKNLILTTCLFLASLMFGEVQAYEPKSFEAEIHRQQTQSAEKHRWSKQVDYSTAPDWCKEMAATGHFAWYWNFEHNGKPFKRLALLQISSLDSNCSGVGRYVIAPTVEAGHPNQENYRWGGDRPIIHITKEDGVIHLADSTGKKIYYEISLDLNSMKAVYNNPSRPADVLHGEFKKVSPIQ